ILKHTIGRAERGNLSHHCHISFPPSLTLQEGNTIKRTGKIVDFPLGPNPLGLVVDALGKPIDGKGPISCKELSISLKQWYQCVLITVALDTIINQNRWNNGTNKSQKLHCVKFPVENNGLKYSIIISTTASEAAPLQYLAPFSGCAAVAYRQISLLLCHPLGRYCLKNLIKRWYQGFKFQLRRSEMHSTSQHPSKVNLLQKRNIKVYQ
ncbi:ATP synthase subunit alpha, partial [Puccinia sorghi]